MNHYPVHQPYQGAVVLLYHMVYSTESTFRGLVGGGNTSSTHLSSVFRPASLWNCPKIRWAMYF